MSAIHHRPGLTIRREAVEIAFVDDDDVRFWISGRSANVEGLSSMLFLVGADPVVGEPMIRKGAPVYGEAVAVLDLDLGVEIRSQQVRTLIPWHRIREIRRYTAELGTRGKPVVIDRTPGGGEVREIGPFGEEVTP